MSNLFRAKVAVFVALLLALLFSPPLYAAKIGQLTTTHWLEQIQRFFQLSDLSLVTSLIGCIFLGILLSVLGCFMVLRKMSLLGDTLGHAVLPGVCLAFLVTGTKHIFPILIGATASGLIGIFLINAIIAKSRIKSDAAMGMILSAFFGLGIVFLTMIQKQGTGNQSGLDQFLFGQAAALSSIDVWVLAIITFISLLVIAVFFKELTATTFDAGFAITLGIPVAFIQNSLMVLTTLAIVASIQAVGVVLVSAMLIIPAATSTLLVHRMIPLLILASGLGLLAGTGGAFLSFLGPSLPTGPFMVVTAGSFFVLAFFFAPRHGLLVRWLQHRLHRHKTEQENILKSIYHLFEQEGFRAPHIFFEALAAFRNETVYEVKKKARKLKHKKWIETEGPWLRFTESGRKKATQLVRNHRLWELFLVKEARLPADHVHVGADEIEHVLPPQVIQELEAILHHATIDPHGKPIPQR